VEALIPLGAFTLPILWTKLWSVPNPWLGSTGAFWPDEFQREQAAMAIGMAKEAVLFWMGEMMLPLSSDLLGRC
jgi:hypothetical protein